MAQIIPAILEKDISEIQKKLDSLSDLVDWVQIDLADGDFVDNILVSPEKLNSLQTNLNLEVHLMVRKPEEWIKYLNPDIFKRVYFHIEALPEPGDLIVDIRGNDIEAGLAINIDTPISAIREHADRVDSILFMSVEPGLQGQDFNPEVFPKIDEFYNEFPDHLIAIDGGVNISNFMDILSSGVDNISIGSAIFNNNNITDNINQFKKLLS
ncbi:MAG: hypothetical protein ACNFW9_02795 [Candidatus Kerfeldbacteria bacterium]